MLCLNLQISLIGDFGIIFPEIETAYSAEYARFFTFYPVMSLLWDSKYLTLFYVDLVLFYASEYDR